MIDLNERALEAAARALCLCDEYEPDAPLVSGEAVWTVYLNDARAAVTAYLDARPPEVRIGQFVIRHAGDRIWIGRTDGEGGEFATEHVEHAIAQFYRANF